MRDNDMFILLRENLLKEYQLRSSVIPAVQKAFQPEPQGIPRTATIYLHKISDYRAGSPGTREEMDKEKGVMREITTQAMLATFQVTATVLTDDDNPETMTAPDLLKEAATIMQSRRFQRVAIAAGANFMRVGNVQSVDVSGDYAGREIQPFFEFVLNHTDVTVIEIPFATGTRLDIKRI